MSGAGGSKTNKKTAKSKSPAQPAYGAPKFVSGFIVRATRLHSACTFA